MGTKMQFSEQHSNLYSFWKETLTDKLNSELKETKSSYILNLASNEYAKAINFKNIQAEVISPVFKDWKNGEYKIISFYAKKARGLMGRYFIDNELSCPEELKAFDSCVNPVCVVRIMATDKSLIFRLNTKSSFKSNLHLFF